MILVDTSAAPYTAVAICGITRAEVLHGVRDPANRRNLLTLLNAFHQVPISDALWDTVGDHLAALRSGGITLPFPDVVLASVAIANHFDLWSRDTHFGLIQAALPALKLFKEPP